MRLSGAGFTEAEAVAKRCWRDPSSQCMASACMGWEFGVPLMDSRDVALPADVAAAFNAATEAAAVNMTDPDNGPVLDTSPVYLWIVAQVDALGAEGWKLRDGSTPENEIADLHEMGTFENELDAGDIELTFERPKSGTVPRGDCIARHARGY